MIDKTQKTLPKSLHTVTVLYRVALLLEKDGAAYPVHAALSVLGIADMQDNHELVKQVLAKLAKRSA